MNQRKPLDEPDNDDDLGIIYGLMEDDQERREEALRKLLRAHGGRIKGMIRKTYGSSLRNHEVDDVLIRTAERAWKYAASFDEKKASLGTWLVRIGLNEAARYLKDNSSNFVSWEDEELAVEQCFLDSDDNEDTNKDNKLLRDLESVISGLPHLQQAIIRADLACGDVANGKQLAERLGSSVGSIEVSRHKAKEKIRTELTKLGHFSPGNK